jgi:hypothetical protein
MACRTTIVLVKDSICYIKPAKEVLALLISSLFVFAHYIVVNKVKRGRGGERRGGNL